MGMTGDTDIHRTRGVNMDQDNLVQCLRADGELLSQLGGFDGVAEFHFAADVHRLRISGTEISQDSTDAAPDVLVVYPPEVWEEATQQVPGPGFESLASSLSHGVTLEGDWRSILAPYLGAWSRIVRIASDEQSGRQDVRVSGDPYVDTDDPVGRYVRYSVGSDNYRVYYEQAGDGDVPVLLLHTAGGDGRQFRNVLANPQLQAKYRMTAMDLPYHGKSVPPVGTSWWDRPLTVTKSVVLDWVAGFIDAVGLDRPIFVGCSLGGQLASDLCADRPDAIRGAVGINGMYDSKGIAHIAAMNPLYRDPAAPANVVAAIMYDASAPEAPEDFRHELAWIYASNQRDTYPADCDYYYAHDLSENGHLIDTRRTPLTILTGEYDLSMGAPEHGGAGVAQKIPGAEHRVMKGLSHFAPSDDPVRFGAELEAALDDIVAKSREGQSPVPA
jgi:pimeloyl-ACP methyl ester carboxylesterase